MTNKEIKQMENLIGRKSNSNGHLLLDRADVPAVFSGAPLRSGFAGIFNWGALLPPGDHYLRAIVDDTQGNRKILEKDISIQEDQ